MKHWVSARELLEQDGATRQLQVKPRQQPAPAPEAPAQKPPGGGNVQPPAAPEPKPAPAKPRLKGPGKHGEYEHDEVSLASRTRPDLGSAADRHQAFHDAYHHPEARTHTKDRDKKIRANRGSANVSFRAHMESGHRYIAKPHGGAAWGHEGDPFGNEIPKEAREQMAAGHESGEWHRRHGAMFSLMSAMGAHHMVPVGFKSKMHQHLDETLAPDEEDSQHKAMHMAHSHAGQDAHIQEHIGNHEAVMTASDKTLAAVDDEHRLHGIIAHALLGHSDGHQGNVLIHETGHPVLIDHDFMLGSNYSNETNEIEGMPTIVSVFGPGGKLDYRANRSDDVGVNYPARMKQTLEWLAEGGHLGGDDAMDMSKGDAKVLQENAKSLLEKGLEGHLGGLKVKKGH